MRGLATWRQQGLVLFADASPKLQRPRIEDLAGVSLSYSSQAITSLFLVTLVSQESCSIKLAIAQLRIRSVTRSSLIPGAQHIISYPSVSNNYKEQDLLAHHSMLIAISEALDTALSVTHDDTTVHHRSPSIHMSPLSPFILNGLRVLSCAGMRMAVAAVAAVVRSVARG